MKTNSVLRAKVITGKPCLSSKLPKQLKEICQRAGVSEDDIHAPSTKVIKSDLVSEAFSLINGMTPFLRDGKEGRTGVKLVKGLPSELGISYVRSADVALIQAEFDLRRSLLDKLLRKIGDQFDALIETRCAALKVLANEVELPTKEEFLSDFEFDLLFLSADQGVPSAILDQVEKETADRLRANNKKAEDSFRQAHAKPVEAAINTLAESIGKLSEFGGKNKRFRQERIDKILQAASDLREQNWLGLPELTGLASKLEELKANRDDVVATDESRKATTEKWVEVKGEADQILSGFGI